MPYHQTYRRELRVALTDGITGAALASGTAFSVGVRQLASTVTGLSPSRYNGRFISHTFSTGQIEQNMVEKDSYVPSTGFVGLMTGWTVPTAGDILELTELFPTVAPPFSNAPSYRSIINGALRKLLIPHRITLTIGTSQSFTLPTWLTDEHRVQLTGDTDGLGPRPAIFEPAPFGDAPISAAWRRPRFVRDGAAMRLFLDVPFKTPDGVLSIDVRRPADTLIAPLSTGVFADSAAGLNLDYDSAVPEVQEVVNVALADAYEILDARHDSSRWTAKWEAQVQIARAQPHFDRQSESPRAQAIPDRVAA